MQLPTSTSLALNLPVAISNIYKHRHKSFFGTYLLLYVIWDIIDTETDFGRVCETIVFYIGTKMITTSEFCKKEYGEKLYKISFDAGFSCPNRDGSKGERGCIFCSAAGSGDFAVKISVSPPPSTSQAAPLALTPFSEELEAQIFKAKQLVARKYKGDKYIAYFQAFTNTYADTDTLRALFLPIIMRDDIAVLDIATRPDCLSEETYELLKQLNSIKPVWVELGLQTVNSQTVKYIRREYDTDEYDIAVKRLNELGIHTITHVILYLPGESPEDMLRTIEHVKESGSQGVKFTVLHILKGTDLETEYQNNPERFTIPTLEEYARTLKECIDVLPKSTVIHRMTGDPPAKLLIEPKWTLDKRRVMGALQEVLSPPTPFYVYMLQCEDNSIYTGISNDVQKRFLAHKNKKGAKYTIAHPPIKIVYIEECSGKSAALRREIEIKKLSRSQKLELIKQYSEATI